MTLDNARPRKLCFVTIGATASFDALLSAVLNRRFLETLRDTGYTDLQIQYGKEGRMIFDDFIAEHGHGEKTICGISITGFGFNKKGLGQEMLGAKGQRNDKEGVVISHAGSGSILDALRISVPLIVVPNPGLLDNHQEELAEILAEQGYVVHGKSNNLPAAIKESEKLRERHKLWPPVNSGADPSGRGLAGVMDDEMGFVD
ncbi:MAG: N-acetylglucosaminyldiphosphodolichol N-acetylglucosaminyltransferase catalytic subunit alg13 [Candelina submexicana]|nr:MAG: N-acetylglucosaminyldiphosphodolichol N-acetylglucosaminyltransferase catalytic subunit alg13 [Candelina submexicana]